MYKYWNNPRQRGEHTLRTPGYNPENTRRVIDDKHIYADYVILKATDANQLYGNWEALERREYIARLG